jgi:hypothetical protein
MSEGAVGQRGSGAVRARSRTTSITYFAGVLLPPRRPAASLPPFVVQLPSTIASPCLSQEA